MPTLDGVSVKEGRLVFENLISLENTLKIYTEHQVILNQYGNTNLDFISNHRAFNSVSYQDFQNFGIDYYKNVIWLEEMDNREKIVRPTISGLMAHIANQDGIYQVGTKIYKINYSSLDEFNEDELAKYVNGELAKMNTLRSGLIDRNVQKRNFFESFCSNTYMSSPTRKVEGFIEALTYYLPGATLPWSGEVEVETYHYQRFLLIWWPNSADLSVIGNITYEVAPNAGGYWQLPWAVNASAENVSAFQISQPCVSCTVALSKVATKHSASDASGAGSCKCLD